MKEKIVTVTESELPATFEALVNQEIKKFDAVTPAIKELSKQYLPLKVSGLVNSEEALESYDKVAKAFRDMVSKRTAVENKRKELKADSITFGKAVDSKAKEITELLSPIENHLKEQKESYERAKKEIEDQAQRENESKRLLRIGMLESAGMYLIGNEYIWQSKLDLAKSESFVQINLELYSDEDFEEYVKNIADMVSAENIEIEKQKKEAAEKLASMSSEMEEIKAERSANRLSSLLSIGVVISEMTGIFFYKQNSLMSYPELVFLSAADWNLKFTEIVERIAKIESDILEQENEEAKNKEEAIGILKQEAENRILEESKRKQDEDNEVLMAMPDRDRVSEYVKKLLAIEPPIVNTLKWKKEIKNIKEYMEAYLVE